MSDVTGMTIITITGTGPTWYLTSEKGFIVYTITNCPLKKEALEIARKWATSWYNYRIEDGTDAKEEKES